MYTLLIFAALLFMFPLLIAINTAFKPPKEIFHVTSLPSQLYFANFFTSDLQKIGRGLLNSTLITIPAMIISTFVGTLAAYPLSQLRFRGDNLVYMFLLTGLYIPFPTVLIPAFLIINKLGLYDTIPGMWLIHTAYGVPSTTFILRNFFSNIPNELREAASLDGCSLVAYYWRILLPVGRTAIATTLILQFRGIWNDFLFGLTFIRDPDVMPVTVQLNTFVSLTSVHYGPLMAATLLAVLPVVVVFLVFKKQFVSGLTGVYK